MLSYLDGFFSLEFVGFRQNNLEKKIGMLELHNRSITALSACWAKEKTVASICYYKGNKI